MCARDDERQPQDGTHARTRDETRAPPHATPHAASRPPLAPPPSQTIPASVALGDNVLYGKFAGSEVYIEGTKFKVVPASECLAKW